MKPNQPKLPEEYWKDIPNYEGLYQVSNLGRVKSLPRKYVLKEKILLFGWKKNGYSIVRLATGGSLKTKTVHKLVALCFVDGYFEGAIINHKNYDRKDNRAENLEWVTYKQNFEHSRIHNRPLRGEEHPSTKFTDEIVKKIKIRLRDGASQRAISLEFNISNPQVNRIAKGLRKLWITI